MIFVDILLWTRIKLIQKLLMFIHFLREILHNLGINVENSFGMPTDIVPDFLLQCSHLPSGSKIVHIILSLISEIQFLHPDILHRLLLWQWRRRRFRNNPFLSFDGRFLVANILGSKLWDLGWAIIWLLFMIHPFRFTLFECFADWNSNLTPINLYVCVVLQENIGQ